jgi:hypothetical protein
MSGAFFFFATISVASSCNVSLVTLSAVLFTLSLRIMDRSQLDAIVSELEDAAYKRALDDALRAITEAVELLRRANPISPQPHNTTRRLRAGSDMDKVLAAVKRKPGLRGVELVSVLKESGTPVEERTLRTALHRLKVRGFLENRETRWFPAESARNNKGPTPKSD